MLPRTAHPPRNRRRVPRRAAWAALAALVLLAAPAVSADIVVLKNGKRLEGRVEEAGDSVVIHLRHGSVKIRRDRIESIVKKKTALDEFHEKAEALEARAAAEKLDGPARAELWFELAAWALEQDLPRSRLDALQQTIAADSDHAQAREALGYVRHDGRWVTGAERHRAMGLVQYEGQWVTPEARDDAVRAGETARIAGLEADREAAEAKLKQAQIEKLEAEQDLLRAKTQQALDERAALDAAWADLERQRRSLYSPSPWYYGYPVYYLPRPRPHHDHESPAPEPAPAENGAPEPAPTADGYFSNVNKPGSGPSMFPNR
ncbi:MAG: hypothetical protein L6R28_23920 [Planctomycetes bacterium]|nr:hypothetical protein [Planctomycetota bacterium]